MKPAFVQAIPRLAARDVNAAVEFYETNLGFQATLHLEDYAILKRDAVEIHLGLLAHDPLTNNISCRIDVRGVAELHERCRALGLVQAQDSLAMGPWHRLEFTILDPDRNLITFAEASAPATT
jgi:catechol 2,3-dioxygenase-like lactoylglutathione lyase family enzyme